MESGVFETWLNLTLNTKLMEHTTPGPPPGAKRNYSGLFSSGVYRLLLNPSVILPTLLLPIKRRLCLLGV